MELAAAAAEAVMQRMDAVMQVLEETSTRNKLLVEDLARLKYDLDSIKTVDTENPGSSLTEIRRYVYAIDDLIDDISMAPEAWQNKLKKKQMFFTGVRLFLTLFRNVRLLLPLTMSLALTRKAGEIRASFHSSEAWNLKSLTTLPPGGPSRIWREDTCSYVNPQDVIGREADKEAFRQDLLSDSSISVIPIVGMAGLGKTTLAQLVYNDPLVRSPFDLLFWVSVADDFNLNSAIRMMVTQLNPERPPFFDLEQLQIRLRDAIRNKMYLLVLDDVWSTDRDSWVRFGNLLSVGNPGSKIIVTTRAHQFATTVGTVTPYGLEPLSDADAWCLFTRMAFGRGQGEQDPKLLHMGKEILKKTGNVPLTIRETGLQLFGQDMAKWMAFANENVSQLLEDYYSVVSKSTYNRLPPHLKRCFAYCALFPRGYEIHKCQLIQLWIAQGFIQPSLIANHHKTLEDVGEECFLALLNWSFFTDVTRDTQGNICSFKMHDLAFNLAQSVSAGEALALQDTPICLSNDGIYHLFVDSNLKWSPESAITSLTAHLRSFIKGPESTMRLTRSCCAQLLLRLRYLRVLDFHDCHVNILPSSIGSLKHLRYLNLSENPFISLPDRITSLVNLQVLDLSYCTKLKELPARLRRLVRLRHLYLTGCKHLRGMPIGMGHMASLQTLSHFVLGKGKNYCKLDELDNLNLRAELTIVFATQKQN